MRSTSRTHSHQVQLSPSPAGRLYVATSGQDVVETGLTLDWMIGVLTEIVRESQQDLALWLLEDGEEPRIVAAVRPAPCADVVVQYL